MKKADVLNHGEHGTAPTGHDSIRGSMYARATRVIAGRTVFAGAFVLAFALYDSVAVQPVLAQTIGRPNVIVDETVLDELGPPPQTLPDVLLMEQPQAYRPAPRRESQGATSATGGESASSTGQLLPPPSSMPHSRVLLPRALQPAQPTPAPVPQVARVPKPTPKPPAPIEKAPTEKAPAEKEPIERAAAETREPTPPAEPPQAAVVPSEIAPPPAEKLPETPKVTPPPTEQAEAPTAEMPAAEPPKAATAVPEPSEPPVAKVEMPEAPPPAAPLPTVEPPAPPAAEKSADTPTGDAPETPAVAAVPPAPKIAPPPVPEATPPAAPTPTAEAPATEPPPAPKPVSPPAHQLSAASPDTDTKSEDAADTARPKTGTQIASLPSAPAPAEILDDGQTYRIPFGSESSDISNDGKKYLDELAQRMKSDSALRLQLLGYAGSMQDSASKARRTSLFRALSVRTYLMKQGIRSTRMDVRALGNVVEDGAPDRVDAVVRK